MYPYLVERFCGVQQQVNLIAITYGIQSQHAPAFLLVTGLCASVIGFHCPTIDYVQIGEIGFFVHNNADLLVLTERTAQLDGIFHGSSHLDSVRISVRIPIVINQTLQIFDKSSCSCKSGEAGLVVIDRGSGCLRGDNRTAASQRIVGIAITTGIVHKSSINAQGIELQIQYAGFP